MTEKKTFRQVSELWSEDKRKFVKLSTISAYSLILENHLYPTFGERTSIVESDVQAFVINKLQSLSRKTVQDLLIVLKMVYRYGVKLHYFSHEEWDIKFPTVQDKQEVEVLTIATATAHQGDFRPPRKKSALPCAHREIRQATAITAAR